MENDILEKIEAQASKIDEIQRLVKRMHLYFMIIVWLTVIGFVLPLIGLAVVIPKFIDAYLGSFQGLM